jgi:sugar lactone lactonase YvrE
MKFLRTQIAAACAALGCALTPSALSAQSLVPVPFITAYAGLPAGGSGTACATTADIPNNAGVHTGDGCLPTQATLTGVYGAFTDTDGNVYITENGVNVDIRVVYKGGTTLAAVLTAANPNIANFTPIPGRIYTLAGSLGAALTVKNSASKYACNGTTSGTSALDSAGNGCPAAQAYLKPRGLFVDQFGNVLFVENSPGNILRVIYAGGSAMAAVITAENPGVTPQVGYVYKLTGQTTAGVSGDGGLASAAAIVVARDVAVDSNENIYLSDGTSTATSGNAVRVIYGGVVAPAGINNPTLGYIYTFAGGAGCTQPTTSCPAGETGDGGPATSATLNGPYSIAIDRFNNVFIADYLGGRIRVVYNSGTIGGIAAPTAGFIYTYAGGGTASVEGAAANTQLFTLTQSVGVDGAGNVYVEDGGTKRIWKFDAFTATGYVIAGRGSGSAPAKGAFCNGGTTGPLSTDNYGDGCPAVQAAISDAGRISFDPQGNIYLGETTNAIVRQLNYNTQFANTAVGASTTQSLAFKAVPAAATFTGETFKQQGTTTTEFADAGTGTCASPVVALTACTIDVKFTPPHDGLRTAAQQLVNGTTVLNTNFVSGNGIGANEAIDPGTQVAAGSGLAPSGIFADLLGNVYVSDATGNRVLRGSSAGTTLTSFVTGLKSPAGITVDSNGNVYIADSGNNRVLETDANGNTLGTIGTGLKAPQGVAADAFGNVFVADTGNNRVVYVAPNGAQSNVLALTGLNAPTQLSFDSNGNLYIVDSGNNRVVELPTNGNQITITLPGVTKPTAVAVDPSGTVYVTDSASKQLLAYAPGAAAGTTLLSSLVTPAALAVDLDANIYLADTGVTSATYLRRSLASVTFPITNVNQTSTASINLTNVGNAALNFPTPTLYTRTGSTEFTLASATTNGCATGVSYGLGVECSFTATFAPTAKGPVTAAVTFNTNAGNAATATAQLIGNGQQLVTTTTTISLAPGATAAYGQTVTVTANVALTTNVGAPTGTVTFTVDNKAQAPQPYGTGTYTLTLTPAVGPHTVSVAFSGDGLYASSAATANFTVTQAATTTALTVASNNNAGTITLVFNATVASTTATGETGSVSFYAGSQLLATVALNTTTRTASYSSSALGFTTNSFTAVYSGDSNFAGSTSPAVTPAIDFAIGSSITSITIPQGGVAYVYYGISALYGATGTLTPTCSGLPANSSCKFVPTTIPVSGTQSVTLAIYTNVNANLAENHAPFSSIGGVMLALGVPLLLFAVRRRNALQKLTLGCAALLLVMLPLAGCGSTTAAKSNQGLVTPLGSSTVTVTFAGAGLTTHTNTFTLIVIPNTTGY